jgi:PAS domain S-box-containing protein
MKQEATSGADLISFTPEVLNQHYFNEHNILNILPLAVHVCNAHGCIINYNKKAIELWGKTPEVNQKESFFYDSFKLYHTDGTYMPHHESPSVATLSDGITRRNVELIMEKPDASRVWIKLDIVPIKDGKGNLLGIVNCFDDITEQRNIQKELDWKTKELKNYIENATIGLHWVDADGIIIWANKAELDMLGYAEEEYIGHHISEFHTDQNKINEILTRLSCNETLNEYEAVLRCKDGTTRIVHINSNVFRNEGKFVHTRCFTVDIKDQKKLFQALKQSEAHYRQLIEGLQAAVYTTDAEGHITMYNEAAVHLWGRKPEIGKELWCGSYKLYNSDGSEMPLASSPMTIAVKEGRPVFGAEIVILRPDGTTRQVMAHPQPIYNDAGEVTGALNLLVDITEAK